MYAQDQFARDERYISRTYAYVGQLYCYSNFALYLLALAWHTSGPELLSVTVPSRRRPHAKYSYTLVHALYLQYPTRTLTTARSGHVAPINELSHNEAACLMALAAARTPLPFPHLQGHSTNTQTRTPHLFPCFLTGLPPLLMKPLFLLFPKSGKMPNRPTVQYNHIWKTLMYVHTYIRTVEPLYKGHSE